jgi:AraC family cel operon transcriptional repressor
MKTTVTLFKKADMFDSDYWSHVKYFEDTLLHKHGYIEFFYVVSETCIHYYNGKKLPLSIGDAFLLMPNDIHTFLKKDNNSNFAHRDILFSLDLFQSACQSIDPNLYQELYANKYPLSFHLSSEQISYFESYIGAITLEKDETTQNKLKRLLIAYILNIVTVNSIQRSNAPDWLLKLISNLNDPLRFTFSLSKILDEYGYHRVYMCREFKKHTGFTMTEYFNNQKMAHARTLLQSTNFSLEKICEILGINSLSYFQRLFKKSFGVSPGEIRRVNKKNRQ